jgi:hypothetical protein
LWHKQELKDDFHAGGMNMCILLLLVSCIVLQANAFAIKFIYITGSWDYYSVDGLLHGSVWFLLAMQIVFVLTVAAVAMSSMFSSYENTQWLDRWSSHAYTFINLLIKIVIGSMIASAAMGKGFPVFSCDIWEGRHASPDAPLNM